MMLLLVLSLSLFSVYPLSIPSAIKAIKRPLTKTYDTLTNKPRTPEELKLGIAAFYDKSSELWEDVWGEHLHHGYYDPPDRTDHVQAQVDMVDKLLDFADINSADVINAIDVGCGLGGSTRHIANRFPNCKQTTGITLSPFQEKRGNELCVNSKIADRAKVMVADALSMPFPDDSFDLVWSLESGEHMPDKKKFVSELLRVANKKGTGESKIIICTWVTRDLKDNETRLRQSERRLLRRINRSYYLPEWCSGQDYVDILTAEGISSSQIKRDDWSWAIAPFWRAVIKSSLNLKSVVGLLKSGPRTIRGALAMWDMLTGFKKGTISLAVLAINIPKKD